MKNPWKGTAILSLIALLVSHNYRSAVHFCRQLEAFPDTRQQLVETLPATRQQQQNRSEAPSPWINFLHIAKNAGSHVEQLGKSHDYQCGVWGSRMIARGGVGAAPPPGTVSWAIEAKDPFDPVPKSKSPWAYEWHVPPRWIADDARRQTMYRHPDTFCVLRHPIDRLISAYHYEHLIPSVVKDPHNETNRRKIFTKGPCFDDRPAEVNRLLLDTLQRVATNEPCFGSCHYLPQNKFLAKRHTLGSGLRDKNNEYNNTQDDNPYKQCNRVLVMEANFSRQFNQLMEDIGCPIRAPYISQKENYFNKRRPRCPDDPTLYSNGTDHPMYNKEYRHVTQDDLSRQVLALARQVYSEDFLLYAYYLKKAQEEAMAI